MSVRTTADEKLDSADEHLRQAAKDLSEVVVDRCWGHDEYKTEYQEEIQEAMNKILDIRRKLNR